MSPPSSVRFLSLLAAPLLVLGSAHELYLRNQRDLEGAVSVLVPFWIGFCVIVGVGRLLSGLSTHRAARTALWAYHAAGIWFLGYSLLRSTQFAGGLAAWALDQAASVPLMVAGYLVSVALLSRRDLDPVAGPLAAFAVVLMLHEGTQVATRLGRPLPPSSPMQPPALPQVDRTLPNIYHLVLDAFPRDLFDTVWPKDTPLHGFTQFSEARSFFKATDPSMASVFTSRKQTRAPSLANALAAPDSLPMRLREAGYRTVAYLPPGIYPESPEGFDAVVWHTATLSREEAAALHRWLFLRLWFASLVPSGIIDHLEGRNAFGFAAEDMRSLRNQRMSVLTQPVTTLLSFDRYLEHEPRLPSAGRYTLVHLLVPHNPFVLGADCAYKDVRAGTDVLAQSRCAARVLQRFVEQIDRLDRWRDGAVLVHSDHGSGVRLVNGRVVPVEGDDSALFLIKPARAVSLLERSSRPATLLDVAPTLLGVVGLRGSPFYEGRALLGCHEREGIPKAEACSKGLPSP